MYCTVLHCTPSTVAVFCFFGPGGLHAPCVLACAMRSLFKYINSKCLVLSGEESVGEDGGVHQGVHGVAGEQPEEVAEEANEVVTAEITLCRL